MVDTNEMNTQLSFSPEEVNPSPPLIYQYPAAGAVKLPTFWNEDPAMWFEQCEAQFRLHSITRERTKKDLVISLSPRRPFALSGTSFPPLLKMYIQPSRSACWTYYHPPLLELLLTPWLQPSPISAPQLSCWIYSSLLAMKLKKILSQNARIPALTCNFLHCKANRFYVTHLWVTLAHTYLSFIVSMSSPPFMPYLTRITKLLLRTFPTMLSGGTSKRMLELGVVNVSPVRRPRQPDIPLSNVVNSSLFPKGSKLFTWIWSGNSHLLKVKTTFSQPWIVFPDSPRLSHSTTLLPLVSPTLSTLVGSLPLAPRR